MMAQLCVLFPTGGDNGKCAKCSYILPTKGENGQYAELKAHCKATYPYCRTGTVPKKWQNWGLIEHSLIMVPVFKRILKA